MLAVFAYGTVVVFVLGLVPGFVICVRNERWIELAVGWLTFGLGWWIGAMRGRPRRTLGSISAALLCAILALGVVGARPVQFFGVGARSLEHSVAGWFSVEGKPCRHLSGANWVCGRRDDYRGSGEEVVYRVHVDSVGCWKGVLVTDFRNGDPARISGCVHLGDYF